MQPTLDWSRWPNFSEAEMRCRCGCGRADVDPAFMDRLQLVRGLYAAPMIVTSGFRCAKYNARIGGGPEHPLGKAADISVAGPNAHKLLKLAAAQFPRIGIKQHGPHESRFVHLGSAAAEEVEGFSPWAWSYP